MTDEEKNVRRGGNGHSQQERRSDGVSPLCVACGSQADAFLRCCCVRRQLLYLAYKNIFHKLRSSYRLIARIHYNAVHATAAPPTTSASGVVLQPEDKYPDQLEEYRTFTEQQIQVLCTEITQLMENSVIKNTSRTESKVFFSKLCGDYYRYCSEVIHDKVRDKQTHTQPHDAASSNDHRRQVLLLTMLHLLVSLSAAAEHSCEL